LNNRSPGSIALNIALLIVTGYAIAALLGIVSPVTAFIVGLGSQVLGTIAFFITYFIGRGDEPGAETSPESHVEAASPSGRRD